ncbi:MAG: adenylate/guanylate cyclase domain-containing protein [Thermodesulfobacteriota bacterium]|nr:adenylate/guanylate cyclase domain-containing protein [Thermodesulfobacteriota bacterium]
MENWGIDLEGRMMRHDPWPVNQRGQYQEPLQKEITGTYGISGQATAETLRYFEKCGGETGRLVRLLNGHIPDRMFTLSRQHLLDETRWYTNEYYFYFQMFCKKLIGRYDWHFGENSKTPLSVYHKIWEKGFLRYTPYAGKEKDSTFSMLIAIFRAYTAKQVDFTDLYDWADLLCRDMATISFKNEILNMRNTWLSSEFWYYLIEFIKIVTNQNNTRQIVEESFDFYDLEGFSFAPEGMLLQILEYMLNKSTHAYAVEIDYPGKNRAFFRLSRPPQWDPNKTDKYFTSATINGDEAIMTAYRLVIQRFFKLDIPPELHDVRGIGTGRVSFAIVWEERILSIPYLSLIAANALLLPVYAAVSRFSSLTTMGVLFSSILSVNFMIILLRIFKYNRNRVRILKNHLARVMESNQKKVDQAEKVTGELLEEKKRLLREKEETARRLKITGVYTKKSLVDIIAAGDDPTRFPTQRRQVCVLFADIYEFTRISESKTPLAIVEMLNVYFERMNQCIIGENGEIDKLIGDGIMAVFSSPDGCVRAAIEMCRQVKELACLQDCFAEQPVRTGIGINFGEVVAGNIGSRSKMDYTVIGDIVNSASRLEALTRHYRTPLIIAEDVVARLKDNYHIQFLDIVQVKGRESPVKIYEVYDYLDDAAIGEKQAISSKMDMAFSHYQQGDFDTAAGIYLDLKLKIMSTDNNDLKGTIDTIDFFLSRCNDLLRRQEKGRLETWGGVYSFAVK